MSTKSWSISSDIVGHPRDVIGPVTHAEMVALHSDIAANGVVLALERKPPKTDQSEKPFRNGDVLNMASGVDGNADITTVECGDFHEAATIVLLPNANGVSGRPAGVSNKRNAYVENNHYITNAPRYVGAEMDVNCNGAKHNRYDGSPPCQGSDYKQKYIPQGNLTANGTCVIKSDQITINAIPKAFGAFNDARSPLKDVTRTVSDCDIGDIISRAFNIRSFLKFIDTCCRNLRSTCCQSFLSALFFAVCSLSSTFTHKTVITTYGFEYPTLIMLCQMLAMLAMLQALSFANVLTLQRVTSQSLVSFVVPTTAFVFYTSLALSALGHMNVTMYTMIRRTVPLATLILGVPILQIGWPPMLTIVAVNLLSLSCVVAGYGDIQFSMSAYACACASNAMQALYFILVQKHCENSSIVDTLHHNAILAIPMLFVIAAMKGDFMSVLAYRYIHDRSFHVMFCVQLVVGGCLTASIILCTETNCALTTSVVGAIKSLIQTLMGFVTFGGVSLTAFVFAGVVMNFSGSMLYIYSTVVDNKTKRSSEIGETSQSVTT